MSDKIKTTISDYLKWRGDLTFEKDSFNDTDSIILCQIGYVHFDGLLSENFNDRIKFSDIQKKILADENTRVKYNDVGLMNKKIPLLFLDAAKTERFKDVEICGYISKNTVDENPELQEQFAALTYILDSETVCIVFRGTDDSVVGWKEDFNLADMEEIPAQKDALEYLNKAIDEFHDKRIIVAGHSKGGNLTLYACAMLPSQKKALISDIYNLDGPGFPKERLLSEEFKSIENKIHSWYPEESVIGMLFDHYDNYKVVKSSARLVLQHDLASWIIQGKSPVQAEELSHGSNHLYETFNNWYSELPQEKKRPFIDSLFSILESSNQGTMSGMFGNIQNDLNDSKYKYIDDIESAKEYKETAKNELKEHGIYGLKNSVLSAGKGIGKTVAAKSRKSVKSLAAIGKGIENGAKTMVSMAAATKDILLDEEQRNVLFEISSKFIQEGIGTAKKSAKKFMMGNEADSELKIEKK